MDSHTGDTAGGGSEEPEAYYLPRGNGRYEPITCPAGTVDTSRPGPLRARGTARLNTADHRLPFLPM